MGNLREAELRKLGDAERVAQQWARTCTIALARLTGVSLIAGAAFPTQCKLLVWRALCLRHKITLTELLDILALRYGHKVGERLVLAPIATMTGPAAGNWVAKVVAMRYPRGENINIWREAEKQRLVTIEGGADTNPFNSVEAYLRKVKRERSELATNEKTYARKPYRDNPYRT